MVSSQQNKHFLIAYIVQTGTWGLYVCVWRFNWWSVQHHQPQVVHKKRAFEFTAHTHTLVCSICSHPSLSNLHRTYAFTLHQHLQAIAAPWKAPDWPWIPLFHSLPAPQLPPLLFPPALFCSLTYQTPISNSDLVPSASFFPSDPAVGAEPGEIQPGSLQDALLPRKSAGRRAAQPEEPARHCQPPHQNHPGTPGDFLSLLLSRTGKEYIKRRFWRFWMGRLDLLDV